MAPKKTSKKVKNQVSSLEVLVTSQGDFFATGETRDIAFRVNALKQLKEAVRSHYGDIVDALKGDLRKPEFEAYITEIAFFFQEADHALKHLKRWARPRRVKTYRLLEPASSWIQPEPYGTALIMGPWNYPFQLVMAPLVAALAAGNTAVIKPSELAPRTARVIGEIIESAFPSFYVAAVQGGVETSQELLEQRFDYVFFTGGTAVGKSVYQAAARHLAPVTLELGGKSPAMVHRDADISNASKRIGWGKFLNAGQTCIAPDYLLVHRQVRDRMVEGIARYVRSHYGEGAADRGRYARIVNERHLRRIQELMNKGTVLFGGGVDASSLTIEPTIIGDVTPDDPVMKEEIFGPVLPVIAYDTVDEALAIIGRNPTPLALYLFTFTREVERRVLRDVRAGGVVINDTVIHVANHHLPFGGVGTSGMGAYHGKFGFDTFSHLKAVMKRRGPWDLLFRYPPYKIPIALVRKIFG